MPIVFMFSGQGSQYYQMSRDLYQRDPVFSRYFLSTNRLIHDVIGISVADIIFASDKTFSDVFDAPLYSGLSLFLVELAIVKTLKEKGIFPDILLGSSFGTLVASVAANCFGEEEAIKYFVEHDTLFKETCKEGCMLGVLASPDTYQSNSVLQDLAELAGVNLFTSYVLSLPVEHLSDVQDILNSENIPFQKLPVSRAYHSRWIDAAKDRFVALYETLGPRKPTTPIVCTSSVLTLSRIDAAVFWRAVRGPMQFYDIISRLEQRGPHHYIDVGPSGTLATFVKYALPLDSRSVGYSILSPFKQGMKNFEKVLSAI